MDKSFVTQLALNTKPQHHEELIKTIEVELQMIILQDFPFVAGVGLRKRTPQGTPPFQSSRLLIYNGGGPIGDL